MYINYLTGKDFFEDNIEFILSDELKNQFLYSNAKLSWDVLSNQNNFYIKVYKDDLELFMIKNHPHPLVIVGDVVLIGDAVSCLNELNFSFTGVLGLEYIVKEFINEYSINKTGRFILNHAMDIMVFTGKGEYSNHIHLCTEKDINTIAKCMVGFYNDALNEKMTIDDAVKKAKDKLGNIYGYFVEGQCVSIVALSRETNKYQSIGLAYTIPIFRGNGYMQTLMRHCAKVIEDKGKVAQLHVDKSNPISNHAYKKIGFEVYCDNVHYKFIE